MSKRIIEKFIINNNMITHIGSYKYTEEHPIYNGYLICMTETLTVVANNLKLHVILPNYSTTITPSIWDKHAMFIDSIDGYLLFYGYYDGKQVNYYSFPYIYKLDQYKNELICSAWT
jgi:hypothetical protein